MLPTFKEIADHQSMRQVSWRYERVHWILNKDDGRWHRYRDDSITKDFCRYLLARRTYANINTDAMTREALISGQAHGRGRYMDIHQAYELFLLNPTDPNRHVVEARILAGQSNEEIANLCALTPEAVEYYEQTFFNVRDRLHLEDYITANVIGSVFQSGLATFNPELLVKYFGYFAGPIMLNAVLRGFTGKRTVGSDEEVLGFLDSHIEQNWRLQTAIMSTALQPGKFDVRAIIEGYTQIKALEGKQIGTPEASAWVASFVKTMANSSPIPFGNASKNLEGSPLSNYAIGHVELRASEQLRLASAGGLPYLGKLADFVPPQPNVEKQDVDTTQPSSGT